MREDCRAELLLWLLALKISIIFEELCVGGEIIELHTEPNKKGIILCYTSGYVSGTSPTRIEASISTNINGHASWPRTVHDSLINLLPAHMRYTQDPY